MDVKTVCLGMLTDGDATGYDLKKQFESSFGHFFAAGYGSIYPALSSLHADGLVDCREIPQEGKPDRKLYSITEAGSERLKRALDNPNPTHKLRSEFLATVCFAHLMSEQQIRTVMQNRLDEIDGYLKIFAELEASSMASWPAGKRFVCQFGKALVEANKAFIEQHEEMLTRELNRVSLSNPTNDIPAPAAQGAHK